MPFTLSHPAAVLPLRRALGRFAVLPALVIGSMAPDFTYYVPIAIHRSTTHTFAAVFWFCLPTGLAAYLVFDRILKAPCAFLLPLSVRRRLGTVRPNPLSARHFLAAAFGVVLGACTHVLWDSFTHRGGAATAALPELRMVVGHLWGYPLPLYKILQHASTAGGATALVYWFARWYRSAPPAEDLPSAPLPEATRAPVVVALCVVPALVGVWRGIWAAAAAASTTALQLFFGYALVSTISTFVIALAAFGLVWRWCAA